MVAEVWTKTVSGMCKLKPYALSDNEIGDSFTKLQP
jgi:hypothetical protein